MGRSSYDINQEEIDVRGQAKKRVDKIEELKEDVQWESKAAKMLKDLKYEKNVVAAIADKIWNIKRSIISKKYLHLVFKKIYNA